MQRRTLLLASASTGVLALLGGCGFKLRGHHALAFRTVQLIGFTATSPLATELARALEDNGVQVVDSTPAALAAASSATVPDTHVVLQALQDNRDMVVASKTAYGQVRSMSVRTHFSFQLERADRSLILPPSEIFLARDLTYNEKDALAKQDESAALNRAMQTDIVEQVMRRLAAVTPEQLARPAAVAPAASAASGAR